MITIILEDDVVYIMGGQVTSINHYRKKCEVKVLFVDGRELKYFGVKEIRFSD